LGSCKAANTPDVSAPLSDLASRAELHLRTSPTGVAVSLNPVNGASTGTENCFGVKPDARAELNGERLELLDAGGISHTRGGNDYCVFPLFELEGSPTSMTETSTDSVRVWDASASFSLTVRDFTARHAASLTEPPDGRIRSNESVTLSSTPVDDVIATVVAFYSDEPTLVREDGTALPEFVYDETKGPDGLGGAVVFNANTIRFPMGAVPMTTGHLAGHFGLQLPIDDCSGPRSCEVEFRYAFSDLPLEVLP
jgi:hypothetical protein